MSETCGYARFGGDVYTGMAAFDDRRLHADLAALFTDTGCDGDGGQDCSDGCPDDAAKTAPGVCGCGAADTDEDGDGVPDCNPDDDGHDDDDGGDGGSGGGGCFMETTAS